MKSQKLFTSELDGEPTAVQIRTVSARGGVVVLCCHSQDRVDLELVANRLQNRGWLVEIVGNIDMDSGALSSAMDHHGDLARFVFCETPQFGPRQIVKYRQFLLSSGVTEGWILSLVFDPENPNDLIENIVQALSRISRKYTTLNPRHFVSVLKNAGKNITQHHIFFIGGMVALGLLASVALLYLSSTDRGTVIAATANSTTLVSQKPPAKNWPPSPKDQPQSVMKNNAAFVKDAALVKPDVLEQQRIIDSLVRQKKIRSLDNILISNVESEGTSFIDAFDYCRELELNSVSGWRLPTLGELRSLSTARLAKEGIIWSSTPGDMLAESFFAWSTESQSGQAHAEDWENGLVVCVRPRFLEDPDH